MSAGGFAPAIPGSAAGSGELTRLRYPLGPGARWMIRIQPGVTFWAKVEGLDELHLPAGRLRGYRIRIFSDLFGPQDVVRVWYGRSGFLQLVAHLESDGGDASREVLGRVVSDQRETLEVAWLAGTGFAPTPFGVEAANR